MSKFKVGDKVICRGDHTIACDDFTMTEKEFVGCEMTISEDREGDHKADNSYHVKENDSYWREEWLELESTPAVDEIMHEISIIKVKKELTRMIRVLMAFDNINQSKLAEKMGVSKSFISKILQGKENMTMSTLINIAEALGRTVAIDFKEIEKGG